MGKFSVEPISITWNSDSIKNQNDFIDDKNTYDHLSMNDEAELNTEIDSKILKAKLAHRGSRNHAPQKDIELGKRSATHNKIATKISQLVAGKGIRFESTNDSEIIEREEELNSLLENGLNESINTIVNGIVYLSLSSVIVTQEKLQGTTEGIIKQKPLHCTAHPSQNLRWSVPEINDNAKRIINWHFYHDDWNYQKEKSKKSRTKKVKIPEIIKIDKYIKESKTKDVSEKAFYVYSCDNKKAKTSKYVSFPFMPPEGIFDNYYPLPHWKTNVSINDIQAEFEASCIRLDYLRNGLHISAIVNVYSKSFTEVALPSGKQEKGEWANNLDVVKKIKSSYNSGKVMVIPIPTNDPEKDGLIEVKELKLQFPYQSYKFFNEESRSTILTAWSAHADLHGITKPESNNLRSQAEYLKLAIMMMQETISMHQQVLIKGINKILKYYNYENVTAKVINHDSNLLLLMMSELAKDFMPINEFREKILKLEKLEQDALNEIIQRAKTKSFTKEEQGSNE